MTMNEPEEPVDDLLVPLSLRNTPLGRDAFRAALLSRTTRLVRQRRRVRLWATAAGWGASYLLGMGTVWLYVTVGADDTRWAEAPSTVTTPEASAPAFPVEAASDAVALAELHQKVVEIRLHAMTGCELEILACQASPQEQSKLFRLAGDRYLNDDGDVLAATRCYKRVTELSSRDASPPAANEDNWLLSALRKSSPSSAPRHPPPTGI